MLLNFQCCVQAVSYMRMYDQGDNLGLKSTSSSACQVMCSGAGQCREPVWGTLPMAKVMRKEASAYTKAGSSLRKPPVPEHLPPKPESVLCSHLYLWLYGGLSPIIVSLGGVNLQIQLIKIPGRDKSVSTYKLLWRFSSLPERVRPATCDCLQPPNRERHEML